MMTTNKDWEMVCKEYCKQKGYELLFVNDADFGYIDNSNNLVHKYSTQLLEEFVVLERGKK